MSLHHHVTFVDDDEPYAFTWTPGEQTVHVYAVSPLGQTEIDVFTLLEPTLVRVEAGVRAWLTTATGQPYPEEGVDRCACGSKYWDGARCHSCGERFRAEVDA